MARLTAQVRAWLCGWLALTVVASLALTTAAPGWAAQTPPVPEPEGIIYDQAPVSADPLPTTQIDGVAWTQAISGGKVYVGGDFTNARPAGAAPGTNLTPRRNLLAYDLATGQLDPNWAPTVNAVVRDIVPSPDGSRIYIGGQFTQVNGATRYRVAALDAGTGELIPTWAPHVNGRVDGFAVTGDVVYIVGQFSQVAGVPRTRVAAVTASTGAVLPFSAEATGGYGVKGIVVSPDAAKVAIAGDFTAVNGSSNPGRGLAAMDAATGALMPWLANSVIRNADTRAGMHSIAADGDSVYSTAWDFGGSAQDGFEGTVRMSWANGEIEWIQDCHGDTYDVAANGGTVYSVGHPHYCGNIGGFPQTNPWTFQHSVAFSKAPIGQVITPDIHGYKSYAGHQAPRPLAWYPLWDIGTFTGQSQAGWTIEANDDYVVVGGEFPRVAGSFQQGLVRFAKREIAPNKMGPRVLGGAWPLNVASFRPGQARLSWQANHDFDDALLTYEVLRADKGLAAPLATFQAYSTFWKRPTLTYTDTDVEPGGTYRYSVRVSDPHGNNTRTDFMTVQVTDSGVGGQYAETILDASPAHYWPLSESGSQANDWVGSADLAVRNASRQAPGQQLNATSYATSFAGTSSSYGSTSSPVGAPDIFSIEAWFRTTSRSGGKIVGFGSSATGNSGSYDRHVYLNGSGRVSFGVYPGAARTITSVAGFNDGQWHHVVATLGPDGQALWLDGTLVGQDATVRNGQDYTGYWRVGGDNLGGWPNLGSSHYLSGTIADVAIHDRVLDRDEIDAHRVASGRESALKPRPADAYGGLIHDLDPVLYWRLGETSGSQAEDSGRNAHGGTFSGSTIRYNQTGALAGVPNGAVQFTRSMFTAANARVVGARRMPAPTAFAAEAWFSTTSNAGGKILGFGDSGTSSLSSQADRHLYLDSQGIVRFGVLSGGVQQTVASTRSLNDGQWHHVVGQLSDAGLELYVDGVLEGTNPTQTADTYLGYWRLGGDASWAGANHFDGFLDEAAIHRAPLTGAQAWAHYDLGRTGTINQQPVAAFTPSVQDLTVSLDASASTDPDGSLVAWAWDLGDGTAASGPQLEHSYAQPGTYAITLTVTDDRGATATQTLPVVAHAPNQPPVAQFQFEPSFLDVSFDGTSSTDPDGTISSHAWSFGDGTTGVGSQVTHAYSAAGSYEVTLTVTDDRGSSAVSTRTVAVERAPNVVPVAAFEVVVDGLGVSVDGSGSSDPDGSVVSYEWDFGDGGSGSGVSASHVYAVAGTFPVTLTVTDDRGATGVLTQEVTVRPLAVVASDSFSRVVTRGWGGADVGGLWSGSGDAALRVAGGAGQVTLQPSWVREVRLASVSATNTRTSVSVSSDSGFAGGVQSFTMTGRQVAGSAYSARVRIESGGVRLYILRDETALGGASYMIPGYQYQAGDTLHVEIEVTGTSPTAVAGRVWPEGTPRPEEPNLSATDTTSVLQAAGSVGLKVASSAASQVARTVSFRDFQVVDPTPREPNVVPVAAFEVVVDGLGVSVDGSGSSDPDGSVVSYAWDFGDAGSGSGVTASHAYAVAGTFPVTLTVTDDEGASGSVTKEVTVEDAPVEPVAADAFERTATSGWGAADTGGSWSVSGGAAAFSVADGQGVVTLAPSHNREAYLNDVSSTSTLTEVEMVVDVAPTAGPMHTTVIGRSLGGSYYGGRVRLEAGGVVRLYALYNESALANSHVLPQRTFVDGDKIHAKVEVSGTSPTTVRVKAWFDGDPEPTDWQIQATSTVAAMQAPGRVGLKTVVAASSAAPLTQVRYDNYRVVHA